MDHLGNVFPDIQRGGMRRSTLRSKQIISNFNAKNKFMPPPFCWSWIIFVMWTLLVISPTSCDFEPNWSDKIFGPRRPIVTTMLSNRNDQSPQQSFWHSPQMTQSMNSFRSIGPFTSRPQQTDFSSRIPTQFTSSAPTSSDWPFSTTPSRFQQSFSSASPGPSEFNTVFSSTPSRIPPQFESFFRTPTTPSTPQMTTTERQQQDWIQELIHARLTQSKRNLNEVQESLARIQALAHQLPTLGPPTTTSSNGIATMRGDIQGTTFVNNDPNQDHTTPISDIPNTTRRPTSSISKYQIVMDTVEPSLNSQENNNNNDGNNDNAVMGTPTIITDNNRIDVDYADQILNDNRDENLDYYDHESNQQARSAQQQQQSNQAQPEAIIVAVNDDGSDEEDSHSSSSYPLHGPQSLGGRNAGQPENQLEPAVGTISLKPGQRSEKIKGQKFAQTIHLLGDERNHQQHQHIHHHHQRHQQHQQNQHPWQQFLDFRTSSSENNNDSGESATSNGKNQRLEKEMINEDVSGNMSGEDDQTIDEPRKHFRRSKAESIDVDPVSITNSTSAWTFKCPENITGFFADLSTDCQAYYQCSGHRNERFRFVCPEGTRFNERSSNCDWEDNVDCHQQFDLLRA